MADPVADENMERVDPTDVAGINERAQVWAENGTTIHPVQIEQIVVAEDALPALIDAVRSAAAGQRLLMVADHTPIRRGGDDLKPLIEDALARVTLLSVRRLPDDPARPFHADIEAAQRLAGGLGEFAALLSVGSGSITDVVKHARHLYAERTRRKLPFISFPTAASVTAYTSALTVLTVDGVKRTLPARPPDVVICDLHTLADAPPIMTQAGFGDILARSVSGGDWFLASQLGMDDTFSHVPSRLLEHAEREMIRQAGAIAAGELTAVRTVNDALLLAGMAMSLVNQTTPLSGWEHAISHFLDLTAAHDGREPALHGGQVGVGTLVAARAYEQAWDQLDLERLAIDQSDRLYRETIERVFGRHDPSGRLLAEVWRDYERKLSRWRAAIDVRREFAERCRAGDLNAFLRDAVRPAADVEKALREVRAPRRFVELDEPIWHASAHAAVCYGHLVRARFTFGDLLTETGWLNDERADELLREAL